jgi:hypothetical protein
MTKRVRVKASPSPRVNAEQIREALGAEEIGRIAVRGSPSTLSALRNELYAAMRSTGGRPALEGTARRPKIPMSDADWFALERLAEALGEQGLRTTPGQIAGQLLRNAIALVGQETESTAYPIARKDRHEPLRVRDHAAKPARTFADVKASAVAQLATELQVSHEEVVDEAIALFLRAVLEIRRGRRLVTLDPADPKSTCEVVTPIMTALEWARHEGAKTRSKH